MTDTVVTTRSPRPLVDMPQARRPMVSFILVTYGTGTIVIDALRALAATTAHGSLETEAIVVDQPHPTRPTRTLNHLLLDTAGVRVVGPSRNLGFGGGCNLGVRHATGQLLAFVNPDIEVSANWLPPLIAAASDGGAAIAAPVLRNRDGSVQSAGHRLWADGSTSPILQTNANDEVSPDYASAACWVMRRSVFDELHGFDESFFPAYYEDVDFALRSRSLGGTIVVPESSVVHHHGASTASNVVPDTTPQRRHLLAKWPELTSRQPRPPTP